MKLLHDLPPSAASVFSLMARWLCFDVLRWRIGRCVYAWLAVIGCQTWLQKAARLVLHEKFILQICRLLLVFYLFFSLNIKFKLLRHRTVLRRKRIREDIADHDSLLIACNPSMFMFSLFLLTSSTTLLVLAPFGYFEWVISEVINFGVVCRRIHDYFSPTTTFIKFLGTANGSHDEK